MKYPDLKKHIQSRSPLRYTQHLQPAAGEGARVYPPTAKDGDNAVYLTAKRRIEKTTVNCTEIDSPQSQANRLEEHLADMVANEEIELARVEVTTQDGQTFATYDLPHRLADAYIEYGQTATLLPRSTAPTRKKKKKKSAKKKKKAASNESDDAPTAANEPSDANAVSRTQWWQGLTRCTPRNATAIWRHDPASLLFGVWFSRFNPVCRFPRLITSDIMAINTAQLQSAGARIDPLRKDAGENFLGRKSSESGMGMIPPVPSLGGVTMDEAQLSCIVSTAAVRRLRFPIGGDHDPARDLAAQAALIALGLACIESQMATSYFLRSGCDLVGDQIKREIVHGVNNTEQFKFKDGEALGLYRDAMGEAAEHGLTPAGVTEIKAGTEVEAWLVS